MALLGVLVMVGPASMTANPAGGLLVGDMLALAMTGLLAAMMVIIRHNRHVSMLPAAMGGLALGLGALTVVGLVQLRHVYGFAFLFGCVTAFDGPGR